MHKTGLFGESNQGWVMSDPVGSWPVSWLYECELPWLLFEPGEGRVDDPPSHSYCDILIIKQQ